MNFFLLLSTATLAISATASLTNYAGSAQAKIFYASLILPNNDEEPGKTVPPNFANDEEEPGATVPPS